MAKQPLRVLFDANPLANSAKSGVGYYTWQTVAALANKYPEDIVLIGHYFNFLGRKKNLDLPMALNIRYRQSRLLLGKVSNALRKIGLPLPLELLARTKADVLFFPNFVSLPSLFGKPKIITIHDLSFVEHPEYVQQKNGAFLRKFVPKSISSAAAILTISESTKRALASQYGQSKVAVVVAHIPPAEPVQLTPEAVHSALKELRLSKKFILFVGTLEPRKNVAGLMRAYALLPQEARDQYSLVLAGGKGWNDAEINEVLDDLTAKGHDIVATGYITDIQKVALYSAAEIFVLPSHYEGFGMPLLEAMSYGLPVVASDIEVFHEVAGDAALFVPPEDPQAIAASVAELLADKQLQAKLTKKAATQLKTYSWATVAKTVFNLFTSKKK